MSPLIAVNFSDNAGTIQTIREVDRLWQLLGLLDFDPQRELTKVDKEVDSSRGTQKRLPARGISALFREQRNAGRYS